MKVEYSDLYKFMVSVGIALVTLAVLVPWLFLREPFDLLVTAAEIETLTPRARTLIAQRQERVEQITSQLHWVTLITLFAGLLLIGIGIVLWYQKIQRHLDLDTRVTGEEALRKLTSMISTEVVDKAESEALVQARLRTYPVPPGRVKPKTQTVQDELVGRILRIEQKVVAKLRACFGGQYQILANQRIGTRGYDVVMISTEEERKDLIIEVKVLRNSRSPKHLDVFVSQTESLTNAYIAATGRMATAVLLVIEPVRAVDEHQRDSPKSGQRPAVTLVILGEEELDELSCARLGMYLNLGASGSP